MHLYSNDLLSQKIYWINKLSGELPETNLMLDYVRPVIYSDKNKSFCFDLSSNLSERIITIAKGSYFSTYWILVSALNILLPKYTRNNDVIVGIPIYNEINTDYINNKVIPLRTHVRPQLSFKGFLLEVKDAIISAFNNQNYDLDKIIHLLNIPKTPNRCPIFDIIILLENIHTRNHLNTLNNDITISFSINCERISANIEYSGHLFRDESIKIMSIYYTNVIENIINNFNTKILDVTFLKEHDEFHLLEVSNKTRKYPFNETINKLFEKQVSRTPKNIPVIHKKTKLTYQELNHQANQIGRLLYNLGVCKGEFVGIIKDRDINFLVAILAIYKAGGAYIPIDSSYPTNRIKYMLSNSEVRIILTDSSLLNNLSDLAKNCSQLKSIICLDEVVSENVKLDYNKKELTIYDKLDFVHLPKDNLEQRNDASDPAYMLYTSGSTGLPKGAIV
nr:AMP-binding protein [Nostoc sp. CreGUA01]